MSGGHWNYRDMFSIHGLQPEWIPKIIDAVEKALHEVDYAKSGDSRESLAQHQVYLIMEKLGEELFEDE
jgi:hypothetical protein